MFFKEMMESIVNDDVEKKEERKNEKEVCCVINKIYLVFKGFYVFFFVV